MAVVSQRGTITTELGSKLGESPRSNWNLGVDFCGGRKTGELGEKPSKHRREPTSKKKKKRHENSNNKKNLPTLTNEYKLLRYLRKDRKLCSP